MANGNGINDLLKKGTERHVQTLILLIVLALLGWFGNRTMNTSDIVIRLEEQIAAIRLSTTTHSLDSGHLVNVEALNFRLEFLNGRIEHVENILLQIQESGVKEGDR